MRKRYEIEYTACSTGHTVIFAESRKEALDKFNEESKYEFNELSEDLDNDSEYEVVAICEIK